MTRQPFFYDITLRDGNQSLKKPWNTSEKEIIFNKLIELNVQAVEVGFAAASEMDFEACSKLAQIAPENLVISALARTVEKDILKAAKSIKAANKPRIHTFITLSPFHMKNVLNKKPNDVRNIAIEAVKFAKEQISKINKNGEVEFSVEHFGDCTENLDFVIDTLKDIVKAGATTINLPNTVERCRIKKIVDMVSKVYEELPKDITISVHNHNDLGMATAASVEAYFNGAVQIECALNGLGERAGNANMYEIATVLYNSGANVPLNMNKIYETALLVSKMSKVPIYEKAPLIGSEALAHRSGIHQDGAIKTKGMKMGAYRPIEPSLIGREDDEKLGFTSQSGKTAVFEIITRAGYPITLDEAIKITPIIKEKSEKIGEVPNEEIVNIYFQELFDIKGPFELTSFSHVGGDTFELRFSHNGEYHDVKSEGNGPLDACINALNKAGFPIKLLDYEQCAINAEIMGSSACAISTIHILGKNGEDIIGRAYGNNTAKANVGAIFNALNTAS